MYVGESQFNWLGFHQTRKCTETTESKPGDQPYNDTSPTVSVLCLYLLPFSFLRQIENGMLTPQF